MSPREQLHFIEAEEGATVTLPCDCGTPSDTIKWRKSKKTLVVMSTAPLNQRLSLMGTEESSRKWTWIEDQGRICSLEIQHLRESDEGIYRCVKSSNNDTGTVESISYMVKMRENEESTPTVQSHTTVQLKEVLKTTEEEVNVTSQSTQELATLKGKNETTSNDTVEGIFSAEPNTEISHVNSTRGSQSAIGLEKIQLTTSASLTMTTGKENTQEPPMTLSSVPVKGDEDLTTQEVTPEPEYNTEVETTRALNHVTESSKKAVVNESVIVAPVENDLSTSFVALRPHWGHKEATVLNVHTSIVQVFGSQVEYILLFGLALVALMFCCCIPVVKRLMMRNIEKDVDFRVVQFIAEVRCRDRKVQLWTFIKSG